MYLEDHTHMLSLYSIHKGSILDHHLPPCMMRMWCDYTLPKGMNLFTICKPQVVLDSMNSNLIVKLQTCGKGDITPHKFANKTAVQLLHISFLCVTQEIRCIAIYILYRYWLEKFPFYSKQNVYKSCENAEGCGVSCSQFISTKTFFAFFCTPLIHFHRTTFTQRAFVGLGILFSDYYICIANLSWE